jgi:hypothetical protein
MGCVCGENEIKNSICYDCGRDIEFGKEVYINGKIYCQNCIKVK